MPEQPNQQQKKIGEKPSSDLALELTRTNSRLRLIEDSVENIRSKLQITTENMLSSDRDIRGDIKVMTSEIDELNGKLSDMKEKIVSMISEIKKYSKKEDIIVLKKYMDLWEPLNFVTHAELEKAIAELINQQNNQKV